MMVSQPQCEYAERGAVFGAAGNLVGVLAEPDSGATVNRLGVLLLTPGMLHSAGPFRLHRQIAARLSSSGLYSLRFDLSGIGESLAIGSGQDSLGRAAEEISSAIDFMQTETGVAEVACFGLCSGADDALYAAGQDERIIGLFSLDGCGYRTPRYYWNRFRYYLPRVFSASKWQAKLSSFLGQGATPAPLQIGTDVREFPSRDKAEQQIKRLAERGVRIHFQYTGGVREYYNYATQFFDMFPSLLGYSNVSTKYEAKWDHVLFLCEHRRELTELFGQFCVSLARQRSEHSTINTQEAALPALSFADATLPAQHV